MAWNILRLSVNLSRLVEKMAVTKTCLYINTILKSCRSVQKYFLPVATV